MKRIVYFGGCTIASKSLNFLHILFDIPTLNLRLTLHLVNITSIIQFISIP